MAPDYVFRPMTTADLPLIRRWLAEPHVVQWWGDPAEQFELVSGDLDRPAMDQFIVSVDEQRVRLSAVLRPERLEYGLWRRIPRARAASTSSSASPT